MASRESVVHMWKGMSWCRNDTELGRTGSANWRNQDGKNAEHLGKYLSFIDSGSHFLPLNTRREDRGEIMDTGGFIELDGENTEQFSQDVFYFISGKHIETIIGG